MIINKNTRESLGINLSLGVMIWILLDLSIQRMSFRKEKEIQKAM
jgi:hypothetical protein